MRFLGVGETNDLGDMYLRLQRAGHEVKVFMSDEDSAGVMADMVNFVGDWRNELDWIGEAGEDGIILFETATAGEMQDELRRDGFSVIGGSAVGDLLETNRVYGQSILRDFGFQTAESSVAIGFDAAIATVREKPKRYVFKLNGANWPSASTYVGQLSSGTDVIALLEGMRRTWTSDEVPECLLMDYVEGVEVGVGAFFNGRSFLNPPNLDWEHKRFFPGDIGEMTGEMGTIVTYRGAERLFEATIARLQPLLAESGYCGYINLNTIVNADGVWPLEFTARFGYPGFAILSALHDEGWDSLFKAMASRERAQFRTRGGLAAGVVLTVPPFPYPNGYAELGKGMPVCFDHSMTDMDREFLHYGEVTMLNGQLATAGVIGYAMVVTGIGDTIEEATGDAYRRVRKVVIPNMRYRNDIGGRFTENLDKLKQLGWIS